MKSQFCLLPITLIVLAKMAVAQIYPPDPGDLKVTAPFDFVAERHFLSRGNYVLRWDKASNSVQICEDGIICESLKPTVIKAPQTTAQPKLVFGRCEGRCFLRQIWFPEGTGLELSDPPMQSEIGRTEENLEAVFLDAKPLCIHHSEGLPPSWH
jgi:hypothetical protein